VQGIAVDEGGLIALHWDDPVDPAGPRLGDPIVTRTGALTPAGTAIPFVGSAGQTIRAAADAVPSGSADLALTLRDPGGAPLAQADRGTSPEELVATLPADGTYTLDVAGGPGTFTAEVRPFVASARTATDLTSSSSIPPGTSSAPPPISTRCRGSRSRSRPSPAWGRSSSSSRARAPAPRAPPGCAT
jgi:hypothetical protein